VQRLAEEAIRESEQRFQNLVREATVGIIVLKGKEKRVDLVNEAYSRLIGRRPDEIVNRNIFDVIPETKATFEPVIEQVRTSGEPFYLYDQPYRVLYGEKEIEGYLNLVYQPYKEANGVTSGVMVLCQDITVQVLARKKADEAEEIAGLAIQSAGLGTFQVDLRSNDIIASARLDEIFDVSPTNDRKQYVDAIHPDDRHIRTEAYERAFQSGLLDYECRVVRKSGSLRWVRVKGRVLFKEDEQPVKLTGVVQDITEEKEFAQELTRQVQERTQDLEQFSYVSHHDLQEPLRKIIMFTGLARADADSYFSETAASRLGR
jgi:PAS domain S-box-containing protein